MKKITVTERWLRQQRACEDGIKRFVTLYGKSGAGLRTVILGHISDNTLGYANWLIVRKMSKLQKVQYSVYAAKQVIKIWEDKHPDDDRPRKAIRAAQQYLKNPSKKNVAYVAYVAYAAAAAARAVAYAADAAAAAARAVAERTRMFTKILKYGLKLLVV